ncbi:aldo/keto reductase [Aspergillus affinis]|uniref:aldo/keto reductase n=1 Tax=Aspergillus affinis TaxID=1070780 RepID=UPI0022FEFDE1|nr:putative aldo-keto reductase [Aspergillus affinis]KAI9044162.1 putative aldo-keto reductase [Aspergillus affinis]
MKMPAVGLGTWQGLQSQASNDELRDSIVHALHAGYRLLDTAQRYGTEPVVGEAIRASGIPRSEITLVTKFPGKWHHDPAGALQQSLDALGLDYIDVFLMHWPCATAPDSGTPLGIDESPTFVETWKLMEKIIGPRCKSIGVSNFSQKTLDALLAEATIVPVVNQVELHALNPNHKLSAYCREKGIMVTSWSTLGGGAEFAPLAGEILTNPLFKNIAANHGCSTGVVSLSWAVQRGISVIPKSSSRARVEENLRLVTLTEAEMEELNEAHRTIGSLRIADHIPIMRGEKDGKTTFMGWTNEDFGWEDAEGKWLL